MRDFSAKLSTLPTSSGVYLMLDKSGQILYVGKAKNLKNRVRQYFQNSIKTEKTLQLVSKIADFNIIITKTDYEALVLENNLIKKHTPHYNILLKDDKTYPYIKINLKEKFPRIEIVRKLKKDGAKYFGPYMQGISAKATLDVIQSVFPLKNCTLNLETGKLQKRECLNYHMKRCLSPCTNKVTADEYREYIEKVIEFLSGSDKNIRFLLHNRMEAASKNEDFELAMHHRDSLKLLDNLVRKQVVDLPTDYNLDIFVYVNNEVCGVINYTVVRGGKVIGSDNFPASVVVNDETDVLSAYIMQFYQKNPLITKEILTYPATNFEEELQGYLSFYKSGKVIISSPRAGKKKELVELANINATNFLQISSTKIATEEKMTKIAVEKLQENLNLPVLPSRIECFDISNISGTDKVASMVVFKNGAKAKGHYRRFKIKTVKGQDDFASMREVLARRLAELSGHDISFSQTPNLIVIDGGKGQLSSVYDLIEKHNINVISLAKREEEIFVPNKSEPIIIAKDSLPLMLLQRLRDEAHRFAITYHRNLRDERQTKSNLKNIEGIGDKKARALIIHFKSVEKIASAKKEDIMKINGFGEKDALKIIEHFSAKEGDISNEI